MKPGVCFIIVDASPTIGMGHLSRCLLIGKFIDLKGWSVHFLYTKKETKDVIEKNGFKSYQINILSVNLNDFNTDINTKIVISDINNYETFSSTQNYRKYLSSLKKQSDVLMSFEDLKDYPYQSDIVVIPYVGSNNLKVFPNNQKTKYLLGSNFFPIKNDFERRKIISKKVSNILVTMGGSDPEKITLKVLRAFNKIKISCNIYVLIGSMSKITNHEIQSSSKNIKANVIINRKINNINELMFKADIAITNSGLTKYELAFVGVPMLIISNNQHQAKYSEIFISKGAGRHLGLNKVVSEDDILSGYNSLVNDNMARTDMLKKGQTLVDGKGIKRIYSVIRQFL